MLKIQIRFFGGFEPYLKGQTCELEIPSGMSIESLRTNLSDYLDQAHIQITNPSRFQELVKLSAFADESQILPSDFKIIQANQLAILPPVCGG